MAKNFLSSVILMMVLLLTACSNDPFVGEWAPDNDPSGGSITSFKSDGTARFYGDTSGGTYSIKGKWGHPEGSENSITVNYDPATIKVKLANPFEAEIVKALLKEMANSTLTYTISEDGERLDGGGNGYFVRYED